MAFPNPVVIAVAWLPLIVCQSVVTVNPLLPKPTDISVRQFEKDYYDAYKSYYDNNRTISEDLKKLNEVLLNQSLYISLKELPLATEVIIIPF